MLQIRFALELEVTKVILRLLPPLPRDPFAAQRTNLRVSISLNNIDSLCYETPLNVLLPPEINFVCEQAIRGDTVSAHRYGSTDHGDWQISELDIFVLQPSLASGNIALGWICILLWKLSVQAQRTNAPE